MKIQSYWAKLGKNSANKKIAAVSLKLHIFSEFSLIYNTTKKMLLLLQQKFFLNFQVCGPKAECKGRLHRPLCYCPDGYEGNPHVKCMEKKSRVGLRFKRFALGV